MLTRVNCSLPFPIASNITLQQYNSFVERKEISGYKLDYKKSIVYIVEIASPEHETVVEKIRNCFRAYGMGRNAPIQLLAQPRKGNSF